MIIVAVCSGCVVVVIIVVVVVVAVIVLAVDVVVAITSFLHQQTVCHFLLDKKSFHLI